MTFCLTCLIFSQDKIAFGSNFQLIFLMNKEQKVTKPAINLSKLPL